MNKAIVVLIAWALAGATTVGGAVLWDQSNLIPYLGNPPLVTNQEIPPPDPFADWSSYAVTDVDTGGNPWIVQEVTVYFTDFNANYGGQSLWLGVLQQARLNVLPKTGVLPDNAYDPRNGPLVSVSVTPVDIGGVLALAITASDLNISLNPGAYWVGMAPLVPLQPLGYYQEVPIPCPRIGDETAWRNPAGAFGHGTNWLGWSVNNPPLLNEDASITILGIPEPATIALLAFGALAARRR